MATTSSSRRHSVSARPPHDQDDRLPVPKTRGKKAADARYSLKSGEGLGQRSMSSAAPEARPARQNSYQHNNDPTSSRHGDKRQTFAERARNLPASRGADFLDYPSSPNSGQPSDSTDRIYQQAESRSRSTQRHDSPVNLNSPPASQTTDTSSPATRSNSQRVSRNHTQTRRDWAPAKSPLKKLEITLNDISKEEKRARVEEAELRLRESKASRRHISDDTATSTEPRRSNKPKANGATRPLNLQEADTPRYITAGKQKQSPPHNDLAESRKSEPQWPQPGENRDFDYQERIPNEYGDDLSRAMQRDEPSSSALFERKSEYNHSAIPRDENRQGDDEYINSDNVTDPVKRRTSVQHSRLPRPVVTDRPTMADVPVKRSNSRKLQKPMPPDIQKRYMPEKELFERLRHDEPSNSPALEFSPPGYNQTSTGYGARGLEILGDDDNQDQAEDSESQEQNKRGQGKAERPTVSFDVPPPTPPPLTEWKDGTTGRLRADDFDLRDPEIDRPWWDKGGTRSRRRSQRIARDSRQPINAHKKSIAFHPALHLKCGPLLRFTGIKRETIDQPSGPYEKETWRGSVMIVTKDSESSYDDSPTLRFFSQPMDILQPPPPLDLSSDYSGQLAPEYIDPTAGLSKVGRDGKLLYVKPVDHIEEGKDLSSVENEDGLFEESPSPIDYRTSTQVSQPPNARIHEKDGETVGKYQEVKGIRLYADPGRNVTFWRFNLEIELGKRQERIGYRINDGSAVGFWVPAKGQSMNIMFHTGNGFGMSVDSDKFSGPDPLWRDVLNTHQTRPFHVMIGGGSQIYNDLISFEGPHFQQWLDLKVKYEKYEYPLNLDIKAEMESFYLENYSKWFSQGLFGMASSQIPMVNMWNDHDIIGGFGSFSDEFMSTPVFSGLGNVAFKYYMLFQHQSVPEETHADEPSWILGADPGRYINHPSRNLFMNLGKRVAFLAIDCRTERTKLDIMRDDSYDHIWDRCHEQIIKGETKHLIVLLGVPVAYPRLALVENVFNSRVMDPVKALSRSSAGNKLENTGILDDQWTAKQHKLERRWLIEDLQELAAEKSVRVTILGGDANLAAIGQFYSNPKLDISKENDYRYMPNVVSSAIVDAPVSEFMSDTINRRNKVHVFDTKTVEDMRPIFSHDVDGKPRNNKRMLPRRNWCAIREYDPGYTPTSTPREQTPLSSPHSPEPPPRKLMRSLSLSRGDGKPSKLLRRFSQRGPPPSSYAGIDGPDQRRMSYDGPPPGTRDSYFPPQSSTPAAVTTISHGQTNEDHPPEPQPGKFIRRRTDLSSKDLKQVAKGGSNMHHFLNLEGGLDISLNCEVDPNDPAGITSPYRVLVPALFFHGEFEPSVAQQKKRWWSMKRKPASYVPQMQVSVGTAKGNENNYQHQQYQPQSQQQQQQQQDRRYQKELEYHDNSPLGQEEEDEDEEYEEEYEHHQSPQFFDRRGSGPAGIATQQQPVDESNQGYNGVEAYKPKKKWFGII